MKKPLSCQIIIYIIIILFIIGIIISILFISNGLENFEREEKELAKFALYIVFQDGDPIDNFLGMKIIVIDVKKLIMKNILSGYQNALFILILNMLQKFVFIHYLVYLLNM
ncbi:MAG: hypothetical protein WBA71_01605 [Candidatus Humimicrobiia bacterium]